MGSRKNWCFTLNNWTENEKNQLINSMYSQLRFGKEIGENGTPHLQGNIIFYNTYRLSGLRRHFNPRIHWEPTQSAERAGNYVLKENDYEIYYKDKQGLFTDGKSQGRRTDLKEAAEKVTKGTSIEEIAKEFPELYIKYHNGFKSLHLLQARRRTEAAEIRYVDSVQKIPGEYWRIGEDTRFFEGYTGQDVVYLGDYAIDREWRRNLVFGRGEIRVNVKNGSVQWAPKVIYLLGKDPAICEICEQYGQDDNCWKCKGKGLKSQ